MQANTKAHVFLLPMLSSIEADDFSVFLKVDYIQKLNNPWYISVTLLIYQCNWHWLSDKDTI